MLDERYLSLIAGYGAAVGIFWLLYATMKPRFLCRENSTIDKPWLETGLLIVAVIAVIGVGQLWSKNLLLPEETWVFEALNQVIIFAPILIILALRGNLSSRAYLPIVSGLPSIVIGLVLAAVALTAYSGASGDLGGALVMAEKMADIENLPHVVQVLLEDIAIAALLAFIAAAIGGRTAVIIVAALFAAAHVPALLAKGFELTELISLVLDAGIGVLVLGAIIASRNVWWFWPIHTVMDLTQFYYKDVFGVGG